MFSFPMQIKQKKAQIAKANWMALTNGYPSIQVLCACYSRIICGTPRSNDIDSGLDPQSPRLAGKGSLSHECLPPVRLATEKKALAPYSWTITRGNTTIEYYKYMLEKYDIDELDYFSPTLNGGHSSY